MTLPPLSPHEYGTRWPPVPGRCSNPPFQKYLATRQSRLKPGPTAESFHVPDGITLHLTPESMRLHGPAESVIQCRKEFQKLERSAAGSRVEVEGWTFGVEDEVPDGPIDRTVIMPWHAWGIVGTTFSDAACGREGNPFDFSKVGYICLVDMEGIIYPYPYPDIGVLIEGRFIDDRTGLARQR